MECEYCKHIFKNKNLLQSHQKNTKYCIKIQKEHGIVIDDRLEVCSVCSLKTSRSNMYRHQLLCNKTKSKISIKQQLSDKDKRIKQLEEQISDKDKTIKQLEEQLIALKVYKELAIHSRETIEELAKQPKNNNNSYNITNKTQIISNLTPYDINKDKFDAIINNKLTLNDVVDGQAGIAKFLVEHVLKDDDGKLQYVCSDPSRSVFLYRNMNGDIEKDIKALKLTDAIIQSSSLASNKIIEAET